MEYSILNVFLAALIVFLSSVLVAIPITKILVKK